MNGWSSEKTWREECGVFAAIGVPNAAEITWPQGWERVGTIPSLACGDGGEA